MTDPTDQEIDVIEFVEARDDYVQDIHDQIVDFDINQLTHFDEDDDEDETHDLTGI